MLVWEWVDHGAVWRRDEKGEKGRREGGKGRREEREEGRKGEKGGKGRRKEREKGGRWYLGSNENRTRTKLSPEHCILCIVQNTVTAWRHIKAW